MISAALLDTIADEGRGVGELAKQFGTTILIDPVKLLQRDIELQPPTSWSPNRHCKLVQTRDGWIAVNLARPEDRAAVAAWLECDIDIHPWDALRDIAAERKSSDLLKRAVLLALPVALVSESAPVAPPISITGTRPSKQLTEMTVIDMSALWAGPLCGGLLAEAGMTVIKVEDPLRPDPTRVATPNHDRRLNGRKQHTCISLSTPEFLMAIFDADILITSARAHALDRLGLTPDVLFSRKPGLIWVAITAHGFGGPNAMRVGFGDDCAAAGGLVSWKEDGPYFLGDALADPLTGLHAAHLALQQVAKAQSGLIDVALASTAAEFAQRAGLR
jgi:hypothetical protein